MSENNAEQLTKRPIIVTHQSPDMDAITSVWLLKRFMTTDWGEARVMFVPAGEKLKADQQSALGVMPQQVIHVDTGLGEFDHHQPERATKRVCAASLVYDHLAKSQADKKNNQALSYIVEYVTQLDLFENCYWPEAADLRYQLMLHSILAGAKNTGLYDDDRLLQFGFEMLDAAYAQLRGEIKADEIIQRKGQRFKIGQWAVLAIPSSSGAVEKRAQMQGTDLVIRKNEKTGHIRIKATPKSGINLTPVYEQILKVDKVGDWFLHNSTRMLLNGSSKSRQNPSPLSLTQIIKIVKSELSPQD